MLNFTFGDVWWLLERQRFKQQRTEFVSWVSAGDPSSGAVTKQTFLPEVYLGEKWDGTRYNNGQQINEILLWVNECYNPTRRGATGGIDAAQDVLQIGTIEPSVNIPVSRDTSIHCSEAIAQVMRWSPDAAIKIDN